jgi:hypothetical protein
VRRSLLYGLAKALEGAGLVIVLVGVFLSISEGLEDQGLKSMASEMRGLVLGGSLFLLGVWIERRLRTR